MVPLHLVLLYDDGADGVLLIEVKRDWEATEMNKELKSLFTLVNQVIFVVEGQRDPEDVIISLGSGDLFRYNANERGRDWLG